MAVMMDVSDRILAIQHGRRIALGPPEDVREDPSVIDAYLGVVEDA